MIFTVASHSGVQEEYHSKVQDPQLQMPGYGIEKYGTKVQQDHSEQQSAADERSEQIDTCSGLDLSSHRYLGARTCWDLATRSRTLYLTRARIGSQCNSLPCSQRCGNKVADEQSSWQQQFRQSAEGPSLMEPN